MSPLARVPSWLLVAVQLGLIAALLLTSWPQVGTGARLLAALLLLAGSAVGIAALAVNRLGNFNIVPEIKTGARLASGGIYRRVRHPMYLSVLLATAGALILDPQPWRMAAWVALLVVLVVKLRREERYLLQRFAQYAEYRQRTWRLLPGIW